MDVTGWNIASRMKLPDHCFGNRQLIGCFAIVPAAGPHVWAISDVALPDPVCIWELVYYFRPTVAARIYLRIGLAATLPASTADMDAADEILPYFGEPKTGPNQLAVVVEHSTPMSIKLRKGMATGGKKLVIDLLYGNSDGYNTVGLVVSELPTKVPGWPGAWPAG